jgi:hypothetical protein
VDACCLALLHHTRAWPPRISSFAKQLAFYAERRVKPRRLDDATRLTLVVLARFIEWRQLLRGVQPETLVRRHRQASPILAVEVTAAWASADSSAPPDTDR